METDFRNPQRIRIRSRLKEKLEIKLQLLLYISIQVNCKLFLKCIHCQLCLTVLLSYSYNSYHGNPFRFTKTPNTYSEDSCLYNRTFVRLFQQDFYIFANPSSPIILLAD